MHIPTIGEFLDSMHLRHLKNILIKNRVMSVGLLADLQPSDIKRLSCHMIAGVCCFTNTNQTVTSLNVYTLTTTTLLITDMASTAHGYKMWLICVVQSNKPNSSVVNKQLHREVDNLTTLV